MVNGHGKLTSPVLSCLPVSWTALRQGWWLWKKNGGGGGPVCSDRLLNHSRWLWRTHIHTESSQTGKVKRSQSWSNKLTLSIFNSLLTLLLFVPIWSNPVLLPSSSSQVKHPDSFTKETSSIPFLCSCLICVTFYMCHFIFLTYFSLSQLNMSLLSFTLSISGFYRPPILSNMFVCAEIYTHIHFFFFVQRGCFFST